MHDVTPPGFPQQPPQGEIPIFERVVITNSNSEVMRAPDGTRVLTITTIGRQYQIPYSPDAARNIGMKLAAPGIVAPDNGSPGQS